MNFKKANIILITLFITILVGIMGLITTKYVINLLKVSSENHKYYKAYYVAYGGLELELLKNKNHWYGFEDIILSGSKTVSKNFTGINYYFSSKILSMSKNITNNYRSLFDDSIDCWDNANRIKLLTWEGLMIPLFYDKNMWEWLISGLNYEITDFSNVRLYYNWNIVVSYNKKIDISTNISDIWWAGEKISRNGNGDIELYSNLGSPSLDANDYPFLIIWAIESSKVCLSNSSNKMVTPYTYIVSNWNFMDRKVTVKVVKYNKWADFSIYWLY